MKSDINNFIDLLEANTWSSASSFVGDFGASLKKKTKKSYLPRKLALILFHALDPRGHIPYTWDDLKKRLVEVWDATLGTNSHRSPEDKPVEEAWWLF
jgi:hypothetical protein